MYGFNHDEAIRSFRRAAELDPTSPASAAAVIQIFPTPTFTNPNGRAVIFSNNVRVTMPTTTPRLEPFFIAGGGIATEPPRHETPQSFGRLAGCCNLYRRDAE